MKNIRPNSLQGKDVISRMKDLMGPITEGKQNSTSEVLLTKIGPDGKTYGIVKENHEYYIKISDKSSNLIAEDFKYIGGLQNKKDKAYTSYSQAIKQLNLKFISLAEANGKSNDINSFMNDNLVENEGCGKIRTATSDIIMKEEDEEDEDEELTEDEAQIDSMVTGEEIKEDIFVNNRFKISEVMEKIDDAISEATNERVDSVLTVLENLSEKEQMNLLSRLKKKI